MIINYKPKHITSFRNEQVNMLRWLQDNWNRYKVFVINAPTAIGKSILAVTVARWQASMNKSTAIITATKMLQDQYTNEFTSIVSLKGKASYQCKTFKGMSCLEVMDANDSYCDQQCRYAKIRKKAKEGMIAIFNYYSYIFNNINKDIVIVDEAHKLNNTLCDLSSTKIWQHKEHYDNSTETYGGIMIWLENKIAKLNTEIREESSKLKVIKKTSLVKKYTMILQDMQDNEKDFFIKKKLDYYRGDLKECIEVKPIISRMLKPKVWNKHTEKIILLSATVTLQDADNLGLSQSSIGYFECQSPIPKANRTFMVFPAVNTSYKNQSDPAMYRKLGEIIQSILKKHHSEKGLIHTTYALAEKLKMYLTNDRLVYYNKEDKEQTYWDFKKERSNKVLIGCGVSEGIDLKYDEARFQIITKVMYPSLADDCNKLILNKMPEKYYWETIRTIMQQAGRIVRSIDDFGITYMIDSTFIALYSKNKHLFPMWFRDAVTFNLEGTL